jgi:hypothetical protein
MDCGLNTPVQKSLSMDCAIVPGYVLDMSKEVMLRCSSFCLSANHKVYNRGVFLEL